MARERTAALEKWEISRDRYFELKYICRQYRAYQRAAKRVEDEIAGGFNDVALRDGPRGTRVSDTTAERALRLARSNIARRRVEAIRRAAMEAEHGIYKQLLRNVTQGVPYEHMQVPCGRRFFFEARRRFFWILDKLLTDNGT